MKKFPSTKDRLPAFTKSVVTQYLVGCMEASKPNCYGSPSFTYADALGIRSDDPYVSTILLTCFEEATSIFNRQHPLRWDHAGQKGYREGYPSEDQ